MKAFLLAAGLGTRLRPLTDRTPKCMLPVAGQPLLGLWLAAFERAGVDEVLVNLHHLPEVVTAYLDQRRGGPLVRTFYEAELLGSAGTLLANRDWVAGDDAFLVCHADNLTDFDLRTLVEAHRASAALATLTLFHAEVPAACGIVGLGPYNRVTSFVEKPVNPESDLANAGMYAFHPSVIEEVELPLPKDIGYHLLPKLVGRASGLVHDGYFRDIGSPASYRQAETDWAQRAAR